MGTELRGWTGAEAWIFLSIGDARAGAEASLENVIAAADSNNHAIPRPDEFSQAVGQLLGAGLVRVTNDRYSLTASGKKLYKQINSTRRGHIERFIDTAKVWRTAAPSAEAAIPWEVDRERFDQSWRMYHGWAQRWIQKHVRKHKA